MTYALKRHDIIQTLDSLFEQAWRTRVLLTTSLLAFILFFSPPFHHLISSYLPQLSSALMFDAVHVVVGAVRELNRSQEIGVKPLSCTSSLIWQHGTSLMNYLRMVRVAMATRHFLTAGFNGFGIYGGAWVCVWCLCCVVLKLNQRCRHCVFYVDVFLSAARRDSLKSAWHNNGPILLWWTYVVGFIVHDSLVQKISSSKCNNLPEL